MPSSTTSNSFLRQLSGKEAWKSTSSRWSSSSPTNYQDRHGGNAQWKQQMEGLNGHNTTTTTTTTNNNMMYGGQNMVMVKRVMVVVDESSHSKHAMMWALTHVANKGDRLTLLHVVPPNSSANNGGGGGGNRANGYSESSPDSSSSPYLATSLGSLCKACKPGVEVEALWIQGPKLATVISQVKKLDISVLILGHKKSASLLSCLCGRSSTENFVDECINNVECLTIGVRKQSKGTGGYLISTRWQKDFWLLA